MVRTRCDIIFNDPTSPFYLKQVNGMDQMMRNQEKPLSVHQKKQTKTKKTKNEEGQRTSTTMNEYFTSPMAKILTFVAMACG